LGKRIILNLVSVVLLATVVIVACNNNDSTNPVYSTFDANSINGTVTFVGTNILSDTVKGYYSISAFTIWPPKSQPSGYSKLKISNANGTYKADYKISGIADGSYYVVTAYTRLPYVPNHDLILGLYGCDTNRTYTNLNTISLSNNTGVGNINFLSYIDTTYHF
jgi:hypothetical protein